MWNMRALSFIDLKCSRIYLKRTNTLVSVKLQSWLDNSIISNRIKRIDMRQIIVLVTTALALLAGCSSSSGVLKVGPDTYTISTSASPAKGGIPAAKRIAYKEAADECSFRGNLEVFVLSEKSASPTWTEGMSNVEVNFRCLPKNDPEFQRQNLKSTPDQVIEKRER